MKIQIIIEDESLNEFKQQRRENASKKFDNRQIAKLLMEEGMSILMNENGKIRRISDEDDPCCPSLDSIVAKAARRNLRREKEEKYEKFLDKLKLKRESAEVVRAKRMIEGMMYIRYKLEETIERIDDCFDDAKEALRGLYQEEET